jgi:hypothetical protein
MKLIENNGIPAKQNLALFFRFDVVQFSYALLENKFQCIMGLDFN